MNSPAAIFTIHHPSADALLRLDKPFAR